MCLGFGARWVESYDLSLVDINLKAHHLAKLEKDIYVSLQGFRAERKEDKIIGPEKMRDNDVRQCGIITRRFEERGKFLDVDFE